MRLKIKSKNHAHIIDFHHIPYSVQHDAEEKSKNHPHMIIITSEQTSGVVRSWPSGSLYTQAEVKCTLTTANHQ